MGLFFLRSSSVVADTTFYTDFTGTENPLSEGGAWINTDTVTAGAYIGVRSSSGIAYAVGTVSDDQNTLNDAVVRLAANTYGEDQYCEGEIDLTYTPAVNHEIELHLRTTLANGSCYTYEAYTNPTSGPSIARWNGANYSVNQLQVGGTGFVNLESGQILRFEAQGNVLTFKQKAVGAGSFTTICQVTDASAERLSVVSPGGQPGFGFFPRTGATLSGLGFRWFRAGPL